MLWELRVSELRYRAVLEVLDGATVTSVARRFGVSRGTVHVWLGRYATTGGVVNLQDRSSRPHSCPHQMSPAVARPVRRSGAARAGRRHGSEHLTAQCTLETAARARTPGLFDDWTNAHSATSSVEPSTTVMTTPFATR